MYFITKKTSETGIKFEVIAKQKKVCYEANKEFCDKYEIIQYRGGRWTAFGGMSSIMFEEKPDSKIWGKGSNSGEYMPKKNTKIGKAISKEIEALPVVPINDLNQCIGYDGAPFNRIGFAWDSRYFGFIVDEEWEVNVPEDCEEVTVSRYREIFGK